MFEIAGGIIIAVLFFVFLPLILEIGIWVIGIGLIIAVLITVGVGIFIGFDFISKIPVINNINLVIQEYMHYIIIGFYVCVIFIVIGIILRQIILFPSRDITVNHPLFLSRKNYIIKTLLKNEGIKNAYVTDDGKNKIWVLFDKRKTDLKIINKIIDEVLIKDMIE